MVATPAILTHSQTQIFHAPAIMYAVSPPPAINLSTHTIFHTVITTPYPLNFIHMAIKIIGVDVKNN